MFFAGLHPASNPNFLWRRESSKETSTPSKASPYMGRMQHGKSQRAVDFPPLK